MNMDTKLQILKRLFDNYEPEERKEFRQTGIAIMSGLTLHAGTGEAGHEPVSAFTIDEIEGCFALNVSRAELLEKFASLETEGEDAADFLPDEERDEERADRFGEIESYLTLLLAGVFAEVFYLLYDTELKPGEVPDEMTVGDFFNYVFFGEHYTEVREKVNALLELTGDPLIELLTNEAAADEKCSWELPANIYRNELNTVWARKTQLDLILALRELKRVPGSLVWWLASRNMKMEEEYHRGITTNMYQRYNFSALAAEAN